MNKGSSRSASDDYSYITQCDRRMKKQSLVEHKDYTNFLHPSTLKANMIKSGLNPRKETVVAENNCWLFIRLVIGLIMVSIPSVILLYFIFNDPLRSSSTALMRSQEATKNDDNFRDNYVYVRTSIGTVKGTITLSLDREINTFLGVPFAEAPIGRLRFAKPRELRHKKKTIVATKQPPPCLQYPLTHRIKVAPWVSSALSSEDCLYLNIWSPVTAFNGSRPLPVMVWLFGGAYLSGSIDVTYYDGAFLASYGDVVVVAVNYRLGVFGFMNVRSSLAPGNMGLHDQVLALKWIKQNIAAFGGDPDQITLFGESAGAFSVGFHIFSPLSRKLFKRAILESGSPFYPQVLEEKHMPLRRAQTFAEKAGCANANLTVEKRPQVVVACLQRLDAHFLAKVSDEMIDGFHPPFGVTIGDDFLPTNPYQAIQESDFGDQQEILIGATKDEGSFFLYWTYPQIFDIFDPKNITEEEAVKLIEIAFKAVPDPGPKLISHFFMNKMNLTSQQDLRKIMYHIIGDFIIVCPSVFFAEQMSEQNVTVNYYLFSHRRLNSKWSEWMGVVHFDEVPFVFGIPFSHETDFTNEERELSARIMDTWVSFAKTGKVPNQLNEYWPPFRKDHHLYMNLETNNASVEIGPQEHNCNLWKFMFQTIASV